jgi:hypothetical protein
MAVILADLRQGDPSRAAHRGAVLNQARSAARILYFAYASWRR